MNYTFFLNKKMISFLMLMLFAVSGYSQMPRGQRPQDRDAERRREAIETRRVSYITQKLSLSVEEARLFWPIYNEYTQKVEKLSAGFKDTRDQLPETDQMNKEQASAYIEAELKRFEDAAALRREYTEKMLKVISVQQVALLFDAERSFNRMLFREAQRRHRHENPEN
ncbi:MAG: hypothetical protein EA394_07335 [Bacteroidia bacterium]|nr:MAG: hypothetical protein EA394_07335 [Bacteroidia bacterium]